MDFDRAAAGLSASLLIIGYRTVRLITAPYKTMRKISSETDMTQVYIIVAMVFLYFQISYRLKEYPSDPLLVFVAFIGNFALTVGFYYLFARIFRKNPEWKSFIFTYAYTLIPTLIWFIANSIFYLLLPPPRTLSIAGKAFSMFFLTFSISVLCWKLILFYLFVRFSTRLSFPTIAYLFLIYLSISAPYSVILYRFGIFRVPFI